MSPEGLPAMAAPLLLSRASSAVPCSPLGSATAHTSPRHQPLAAAAAAAMFLRRRSSSGGTTHRIRSPKGTDGKRKCALHLLPDERGAVGGGSGFRNERRERR